MIQVPVVHLLNHDAAADPLGPQWAKITQKVLAMQYSQTFVDRVGGANVKQRAAAVIPIELRASN